MRTITTTMAVLLAAACGEASAPCDWPDGGSVEYDAAADPPVTDDCPPCPGTVCLWGEHPPPPEAQVTVTCAPMPDRVLFACIAGAPEADPPYYNIAEALCRGGAR